MALNFGGTEKELASLKAQLLALESKVTNSILTTKTRRQELAVDLLSKWSTDIEHSVSSTRRFVEGLNEADCDRIYNMDSLEVPVNRHNADKLNLKLLKASLGNDITMLDEKTIFVSEEQTVVLRYQVAKYLNLLESIMVAWQRAIAEPEIIEQEFAFLRSSRGNRFVLSTYRDALNAKEDRPDPYPAIRKFEESLIPQNRKLRYDKEREDFLKEISDEVQIQRRQLDNKEEAIISVVNKKLEESNKKDTDEMYDWIRYLASESVKAGFPTIARKTFDILLGFLL